MGLTRQIFNDEIGWLPWRRPGYELGLWLADFCENNLDAKGVILESHGLFTWADDAQDCHGLTLRIIQQAMDWFEVRTEGQTAFGRARYISLDAAQRVNAAVRLIPAIRGQVSGQHHMVGHFDDNPAVLEVDNARDLLERAALGTSCPDHFLRTKIRPMVLDLDPAIGELDATLAVMPVQIATYRDDYTAYCNRCKHDDSPALRDPNPVNFLVPGVGMISFAKDKTTARIYP